MWKCKNVQFVILIGIALLLIACQQPSPPKVPLVRPRISNIKENEIQVTWEKVPEKKIRYTAVVMGNGSVYEELAAAGKQGRKESEFRYLDEQKNEIAGYQITSDNTAVINNLEANTEYYVMVLAANAKTGMFGLYPMVELKTLRKTGVSERKKPEIDFSKLELIAKPDMVFVEGGSMEIQGKMVTLDSFYINKYELTYEIYRNAHNWAYDKGYLDNGAKYWDGPKNFEVARMQWQEAVVVCNYLSMMEELEPVYYKKNKVDPITHEIDVITDYIGIDWEANGYRIPTEAEWEYAARGGKLSKGYIYSGSDNPDEVAWYTYADLIGIPSGLKKANELGLFDMSGNAGEWCIEIWEDNPSMKPSHNPNQIDISEFEIGEEPRYRILKGGFTSSYGSFDIDGELEYFKPESRIKAYHTREDMYGHSYEYWGTIRLIRNSNEVIK